MTQVMVKEVGKQPYLLQIAGDDKAVDREIKRITGAVTHCVAFQIAKHTRACLIHDVNDPDEPMPFNFMTRNRFHIHGTGIFVGRGNNEEIIPLTQSDVNQICAEYGWQSPYPDMSWGPTKIMNWINDKYDFTPIEITSYEEAYQFSVQYVQPIGAIAPSFFETLDAEISIAVIDNWGDKQGLIDNVYPLLLKSTYFTDRNRRD